MIIKNATKFMSLDGMNNLKAAVVYQACLDYLKGGPQTRRAVKSWMHSNDFSFWCDIDPNTILHRLDKMVEEGRTKLNNLYEEDVAHTSL